MTTKSHSKLEAAWFFILSVTLFDVCFAIAFQGTFSLWEANPIQLWCYENLGMPAVILFRLGTTLSLLMTLPYVKSSYALVATAIVLVANATLILIYFLLGVHNWALLA